MKKGFTLVELIVTVSIILIMLALSLPSFSNYGRENELYQTYLNIKSAIDETKNYALAPRSEKNIDSDVYRIEFICDSGSKKYSFEILEVIKKIDAFGNPELDVNGKQIELTNSVKKETLGSKYTCSSSETSPIDIDFSISKQGKIISPSKNVSLDLISSGVNGYFIKMTINYVTGLVSYEEVSK